MIAFEKLYKLGKKSPYLIGRIGACSAIFSYNLNKRQLEYYKPCTKNVDEWNFHGKTFKIDTKPLFPEKLTSCFPDFNELYWIPKHLDIDDEMIRKALDSCLGSPYTYDRIQKLTRHKILVNKLKSIH